MVGKLICERGQISIVLVALVTYLEDMRKAAFFDNYESKVLETSNEENYAKGMKCKRQRKFQLDEVKKDEE